MRLIIATILAYTAIACSGPSNHLIGQWKAEKYQYIGKQQFDNELLAETERLVLTYEYTFNKDGSCIFDDFLQQPRKGIWEINGDSLIVEIEDILYNEELPEGPDNRKTQRTSEFIVSLTATEMVLILENRDRFTYRKQ